MDFCAWIPPFIRMRNGRTKWVMRKAVNAYLPHSVTWRSDKTHIGARFDRIVLQPILDQLEPALRRGTAEVQAYVDRDSVLGLADRWGQGELGAVLRLTPVLLLEHWLRHNRDKVAWGT